MMTETQRKVWPPVDDAEDSQSRPALECRRCGCKHFLADGLRKSRQTIYRTRRCRHCGQRVTTCERPASPGQ